MGQITSLKNVNALALPAKVLVLLSKYAQALRAHNGTVLKLSSLRVFKHIHTTCMKANDQTLIHIYVELLREVNIHLEAGTMYTNDVKKELLKNKKTNTLNKLRNNFQSVNFKKKPTINTSIQ